MDTLKQDARSAVAELMGRVPEPAAEKVAEAPAEEAQPEEVAEPADDVLESESAEPTDEPAEDAAESEGDVEQSESEAPERLFADEYKSVEDLEASHREVKRQQAAIVQQLEQTRHQLQQTQARAIQAQAAAVPEKSPTFEMLTEAAQTHYAAESQRTGIDANLLIRADWQRDRDRAEAASAQSTAYLRQVEQAQNQACDALYQHAEKHGGEAFLKEFAAEMPDFFRVLDQLEPRAIERFGKAVFDLYAGNRRLQAESTAKADAVRKQVRAETREIRTAKAATKSEAGRAGSAPSLAAPKKTQPETSRNAVDDLLKRHKL